MNIETLMAFDRAGVNEMRNASILLAIEGARGRPVSVREVAEICGVSRPVVSRFCDRLQGLKLISRLSARDDRRRVELRLTRAGVDLLDRVKATVA